MTLFQSIVLGIVQGLTEFLPVSSSGHLVIIPYLLGWQIPKDQAFVFDVLVQVSTLAGVFAYFWADLMAIARAVVLGIRTRQPFADPYSRLGWYILLATLPAGFAGLAIKGLIENTFSNALATAWFLMGTAVFLVVAERLGKRQKELFQLTWKDALWIGIFQAFALFPGISRSGATMTGGMAAGFQRQAAARFSFLMSIPIMLAAGLLAGVDMLEIPNLGAYLPALLPGMVTAAVVGYLSIRWLLRYLTHRPLYIFAAYCLAISLVTQAVIFFGV